MLTEAPQSEGIAHLNCQQMPEDPPQLQQGEMSDAEALRRHRYHALSHRVAVASQGKSSVASRGCPVRGPESSLSKHHRPLHQTMLQFLTGCIKQLEYQNVHPDTQLCGFMVPWGTWIVTSSSSAVPFEVKPFGEARLVAMVVMLRTCLSFLTANYKILPVLDRQQQDCSRTFQHM